MVENDANTLTAFSIPNCTLINSIPVLLKQQCLQTNLNPLRLVDTTLNMWTFATLVVNWRDNTTFGFHYIDLSDHTKTFR